MRVSLFTCNNKPKTYIFPKPISSQPISSVNAMHAGRFWFQRTPYSENIPDWWRNGTFMRYVAGDKRGCRAAGIGEDWGRVARSRWSRWSHERNLGSGFCESKLQRSHCCGILLSLLLVYASRYTVGLEHLNHCIANDAASKDAKDRRQCCVARRASQLSDLPGRGSKQHAVPHPSFEGIRRRAMGMVCGFLRDVGISLGCLTQRIRGSKRRKSVLPWLDLPLHRGFVWWMWRAAVDHVDRLTLIKQDVVLMLAPFVSSFMQRMLNCLFFGYTYSSWKTYIFNIAQRIKWM